MATANLGTGTWKAEADVDDLVAGFARMKAEIAGLEGAEEKLAATQAHLASMSAELGREMKGMYGGVDNTAFAFLEFSRAVEDAQYGMSGVLNNIPGMIMGLGGGMGVAAAVSLTAVAVKTLSDHWDELVAAFGVGIDPMAEAMKDLAVQTEAAAKSFEALMHAVPKAQEKEVKDLFETIIESGREDVLRGITARLLEEYQAALPEGEAGEFQARRLAEDLLRQSGIKGEGGEAARQTLRAMMKARPDMFPDEMAAKFEKITPEARARQQAIKDDEKARRAWEREDKERQRNEKKNEDDMRRAWGAEDRERQRTEQQNEKEMLRWWKAEDDERVRNEKKAADEARREREKAAREREQRAIEWLQRGMVIPKPQARVQAEGLGEFWYKMQESSLEQRGDIPRQQLEALNKILDMLARQVRLGLVPVGEAEKLGQQAWRAAHALPPED